MDILIDILKDAGSIILVLIPLLIPQVREFIIKRYQLSLDKALEDKKASNERKNYVSKVRFDKEFEIYQELSEEIYDVMDKSGDLVLITRGAIYQEYILDKEESFHLSLRSCFSVTRRYAPFIKSELFEEYEKFNQITKELYSDYGFWKNANEKGHSLISIKSAKYNNRDISLEDLVDEIFKNHQLLSELTKQITIELRTHLENLEVKENG